MADNPKKLREQAARYMRLASKVTDENAASRLRSLADKYIGQAVDSEYSSTIAALSASEPQAGEQQARAQSDTPPDPDQKE